MTSVRFYYDVVCPYSFMETHAVEAAEDAGEVEVEWLPFELRPAPRPLLEPRGDHLRMLELEQGRLREFKHALYEAFFCEGEDIATDAEIARAGERAGLNRDGAVEAAYSPERFERIRAIRREAEAAGVRGVPSLLTADGESHWGMGGLARLLAGEALVPRSA